MKLSHFADNPVTLQLRQGTRTCFNDKPDGFWVSIDGEDDWPEWCKNNNFGCGKIRHEVTLRTGHNILILDTVEKIREFSQKYQKPAYPDLGLRFNRYSISWEEVAKTYGGVIIAPYQWSIRLDHEFFWYYGWDCASGCIWDTDNIESVRVVEYV